MPFKPIKFFKNLILEILNTHESKIHAVPDILLKKAVQDSAEFANKNMSNAMMFFDHHGIWDYSISKIKIQLIKGKLLEFGVYQGTSINYFSKNLPDLTFYGFDSFEGLKEDWQGWSLRKGAFNLNGQLPSVNQNVQLIKGWFDQSLPEFIQKNNIESESIRWIHIDCDTYEATEVVFSVLFDKIGKGTLILFDEFFGYRGWEEGEFKAFNNFLMKSKLQFRYLAFARCQVLIEIM